jgi:hypothetical protein
MIPCIKPNLAGGGPDPGAYDYADVLGKSMLFYEAQQSGYIKGNGNRYKKKVSMPAC